MKDSVTIHDKGLEGRQKALAREMPESKTFMGGEACFSMRMDEEVYENARLANLEETGGRNIWDDKEYCRDMARRHPELVAPRRGNVFAFGQSTGAGKPQNRFGRVASRTRIRGQMKIVDDFSEGVRTVTDLRSREVQRFDLESGEALKQEDAGRMPALPGAHP